VLRLVLGLVAGPLHIELCDALYQTLSNDLLALVNVVVFGSRVKGTRRCAFDSAFAFGPRRRRRLRDCFAVGPLFPIGDWCLDAVREDLQIL
jgi:hypothetical protein